MGFYFSRVSLPIISCIYASDRSPNLLFLAISLTPTFESKRQFPVTAPASVPVSEPILPVAEQVVPPSGPVFPPALFGLLAQRVAAEVTEQLRPVSSPDFRSPKCHLLPLLSHLVCLDWDQMNSWPQRFLLPFFSCGPHGSGGKFSSLIASR